MYLMIDNYDSFTYNLVQLFGVLGVEMVVRRNDAISVDQIRALEPRAIVLSPGPCTPDAAGVSLDVVACFLGEVPILGVCLGHQSIAQQIGGEVIRAPRILHGKTSPIFHDESDIFRGVPSPFDATRYHSLTVRRDSLPSALRVTAETADNEIMGLSHRETLCIGVQFHPESVLSKDGPTMMGNFVDDVGRFWANTWEPAC